MVKGFRRTILLLLFSLFLHGQSNAKSMTPELLVSLKQVNQAKIASDGEQIAFIQNRPRDVKLESPGPDWQELYLANDKGQMRPLITGFNQIEQLHWSADSSQIWMLMRRQHEPFFSIYMIRPDGGEAIKILGRQQHIYGFALHSQSQTLAFWYPQALPSQPDNNRLDKVIEFEQQTEYNHHLFLLSLDALENGEKQLPLEGHVLQAQFSPDGKHLLVKKAASYLKDHEIMQPEFALIDRAGKTTMQISGMGKLGKAVFSPKSDEFAFIAAETPSSPDHGALFISNPTTQKTAKLLTDFQGMVTDISWPETRSLLFSADVGVRSIIAKKRPDRIADEYRTLYKDELIIRQIHASDNDNNFTVVANNQNHPNEMFWYKKGRLKRFSNSNPELYPSQLGQQKVVQFQAEDGLQLEGILISPADMPDKTLPATVIFAHGGPESHVSDGWVARFQHPVHHLASMGIQSFLPNYRGSSGRGDVFLKLGQGDYAGAEFADLIAAKNALLKQKLASPVFAISGASYGGYAAAWGATYYSDHFRAAVSISGISNNISKFGTTDIATEMLQTHALSTPQQSWQAWLQASPVYYSDRHNTPILIMHGQRDPRVHYSQSMELYRHLSRQKQAPVSFILYPEQGHHIIDAHTQLDVAKRLIDWFSQHLNVTQD